MFYLEDKKQYSVEVKDDDLFLHGTSLNNFISIKTSGFLKQVPLKQNWGISPAEGIHFEKYVKGKNGHMVKRVEDDKG